MEEENKGAAQAGAPKVMDLGQTPAPASKLAGVMFDGIKLRGDGPVVIRCSDVDGSEAEYGLASVEWDQDEKKWVLGFAAPGATADGAK